MSRLRRLLVARALWTAFVVVILLSGVFLGLAVTMDPSTPLGGEVDTGRYGEIHDQDTPLVDRYVQYMGWYATGDLGESVLYGRPVTAVLADTLPVTGLYLLPAVAAAALASLGLGVAAGLNEGGAADRLSRAVSGSGLALPAVVLADVLAFAVATTDWYVPYDPAAGTLAPANLLALAFPAAVVAFNLLAIQLRGVHGESAAYASRGFVRALRAGGADDRRIGRHVLRNAAPALVSLFVAEAVATLVVSVYVVEVAFGVPGFGLASYRALTKPDVALLVPAVVLPVLAGVVGNTVQDVFVPLLDPRVER